MMKRRGNQKRMFLLLTFFIALGVGNFAQAQGDDVMADDSSPPLVQEFWDDDVSDGPATGLDRISLELESMSTERVEANVSLLFIVEDEPLVLEMGKKKMDPEETVTLSAKLNHFPVQSSSVSTQIVIKILAELPSGETREYFSDPRYFHIDPEDETITVYTEKQMAEYFNGGLVDETDSSVDMTTVTLVNTVSDEELEQLEEENGQKSWDGEDIYLTGAVDSDLRGSIGSRVCGYWNAVYEDDIYGDDGFDEGSKTPSYKKARYAMAKVMDRYGDTVWSILVTVPMPLRLMRQVTSIWEAFPTLDGMGLTESRH